MEGKDEGWSIIKETKTLIIKGWNLEKIRLGHISPVISCRKDFLRLIEEHKLNFYHLENLSYSVLSISPSTLSESHSFGSDVIGLKTHFQKLFVGLS